ncbi:MAG: PIN domain-containing protein [Acidimicrobiaceae bacterium]|nr:PIN domain-containing protein [Acidimicrobiaceae bacterium]
MIIPDVNILVYAFHADAVEHDLCAKWLNAVLGEPVQLGLVDAVLTGFLRVVTNQRIFTDAATMKAALLFTDILRSAPRSQPVLPTDATWDQFAMFAERDPFIVGNLVPDAWIAALAITNSARVATADTGFARFEGLSWFNPAEIAT